MKSRLLQIGLGVSLVAAAAACTNNESETSNPGVTSTSSGSGGGGGTGNTGHGGQGGDLITNFGGAGGSESCLTTEAEAEQKPLDMIVLLDRSASMSGTVWTSSVNALVDFFSDTTTQQDTSVALNYFPPINGDECTTGSYNPPQVSMTPLETSASVLIADIQAQSPEGNYTPTYGALYGTLQYAGTYQDANPDHVVIAVLASDGDPTSCNTNISDISDIAQTALDYNGVQTYVIAIQGATVANLDQIAYGGGTAQAFDVTADISQFKQKMIEIRQHVLACEYYIPEPGEGEEFEPTKVNVKYTPGDSDTAQLIPQADDLEDCGEGQGWYYDNPTAPTKITFCPATCELLKQDGQAKVDFEFGCPTRLN